MSNRAVTKKDNLIDASIILHYKNYGIEYCIHTTSEIKTTNL